MEISIQCGSITFHAQLHNTPTAHAIYAALPFSGTVQRWGQEAYFAIPVYCDLEPDASDTVGIGELAYWPSGQCFCMFWGQTPIRAVSIFGKITTDIHLLESIQQNDRVEVAKI